MEIGGPESKCIRIVVADVFRPRPRYLAEQRATSMAIDPSVPIQSRARRCGRHCACGGRFQDRVEVAREWTRKVER